MASIADIDPQSARMLLQLRDDMTRDKVIRQLASTALQTTSKRHRLATVKARQQHKRRPKVTLA